MLLILSFLVFLSIHCSPKLSPQHNNGWKSLLVDDQLANFEKLNGQASYYLEGNELIGTSKSNTPNTFLCTKEKYGDFILEFEVWADPLLNSGVQIRSISDPNIMDGRVHGYQVEIESSDRKWAGGIYEEGKRGWLYPLDSNPKGQQAFKVNEWNHYRIEAIGDEIATWVNSIQCANLKDDVTASGFIGFQVHDIGGDSKLENRQIKWKNIKIKTTDLKKAQWKRSPEAKLFITNKK